jgi:hypothetical protein
MKLTGHLLQNLKIGGQLSSICKQIKQEAQEVDLAYLFFKLDLILCGKNRKSLCLTNTKLY